jgi:tetratricopeptide (TPR) repeat protein
MVIGLRPIACAALAFVLAMSPAATAQRSDLTQLEQRFHELKRRGDYAGAISVGRQLEAAVRARFGPDHINNAVVANNLANAYSDLYRAREAEDLFKRAIAIYLRVEGPEHPDVADTYYKLRIRHGHAGQAIRDNPSLPEAPLRP